MKRIASAVLGLLFIASTANATEPTKAAGTPAVKPGVAAPAMAAPQPPAELEQLKAFVSKSSWKCEEKMMANAFGMGLPEHTLTATIKTKKNPKNPFWYDVDYAQNKSKTHPVAYVSNEQWGYDTTNKVFVRMMTDNMGGYGKMTSPGWEGDKMVWTGSMTGMGKKVEYRATTTKNTNGTMSGNMEAKINGNWVVQMDCSCK